MNLEDVAAELDALASRVRRRSNEHGERRGNQSERRGKQS